MKLKRYGTASILLEQDGTQLLFDPFFPLSGKVFKPSLSELSAVKNILVTHGHLDHLAGIPTILKHGGGTVYCTAKQHETLISKGVDEVHICKIAAGDVLNFGPVSVRVLKGKHIVFDKRLILKTFLRACFSNWGNLRYLLKENKQCLEAGETVVYDISVSRKRVLLLGSLNLDDGTAYPAGVDLLILPLQGRSDISQYAMQFAERLQPKKILLDHFDDTFPPISSRVNTDYFTSLMRQKFPDIPVICPQAGDCMDIE